MNFSRLPKAGIMSSALSALILAACAESGTGTTAQCATGDCAEAEVNAKKTTSSKAQTAPATATQEAAAAGIPCDIAAILETRCGDCHGAEPSFGAPMSLTKAADFAAEAVDGSKMAGVVKTRISASDPRRAMPPASSDPLTADEKSKLTAWLDKGAPASSETCGGGATEGSKPAAEEEIDRTGLECFKLTAHSGDLKTPYAVGAARDAYYNFTFNAPWKGMAYGVIFKPIIDNKNVIHHWLLFQDTPKQAAGGAKPSVGAHPGSQLLAGWAPGGETLNLRTQTKDEVALELPDTSSYTIEFHYNSSDAQAKDASGVEVCVQREKPANIASLHWLGYDQLLVPSAKWTGTCKPNITKPVKVLGVTPHMHKQGTHMKGTITRADGKTEVLHDAPFDFEYQRQYNKEVTINPGDSITTECTYAKPMAFGESTEAEMCYLFTLAYPKNSLSDTGVWGSIAHGSGSCLGQ